MTDRTRAEDADDSLDRIAADLLALKNTNDPISYAEICRRVGTLRVERGVAENAAFPARSTIYDVFRAGRTRMDPHLLRDVVRALGESTDVAEEWVRRYGRLRRGGEPAPRPTERRAAPPAPAGTAPAAPRTDAALPVVDRRWRFPAAALLLACLFLNFAGMGVVELLHLPVYLDMVGTATTALVLGPWYAAAVGLVTNLCGFVVGAPGAPPYALVNIAGALVWGLGVRRFAMGRDISRYFTLNVLVAVACSLVGAPLNVLLYGGYSGHGSDSVTASFAGMGVPVIAAAFSSNILTSVIDKLLTGFIALMAFVWLYRMTRISATTMPFVEHLTSPRRRSHEHRRSHVRATATPVR